MMMDAKSFDDLLLRHGPAIDAWPPADRAAAESLLASDETARARLAADRRIARLVREAIPAPAGERAILPGVVRRLAAAEARSRASRSTERLAGSGRWLAPAPLAGGALGLALLAMAGGYGLAPGEAAGTDALLVAIAEGRVAEDLTLPADAAAPAEGL